MYRGFLANRRNDEIHSISLYNQEIENASIKEKKMIINRNKCSNFKLFLKSAFKNSLITSFPEIATTKSKEKRIVKIVIFIGCLFGFIYQTNEFLEIYLTYPTSLNVELSSPVNITLPAITFCNKNRRKRSIYCTTEPDRCWNLNDTHLCNRFPKFCSTYKKKLFGSVAHPGHLAKEADWNQVAAEAHNAEMISGCQKSIDGERENCTTPYRRVPFITTDANPNYCFTIDSLWGQPSGKDYILSKTIGYKISLIVEPEEYTNHADLFGVHAVVHDRRQLVNPYFAGEGFFLEAGKDYLAIVSMTEEQSLPYPYQTRCTDYVELWRNNNGTGPWNQQACIQQCILNIMKAKGWCIDNTISYPHEEKLCDKDTRSPTTEIMIKCTEKCGSACKDYKYEMKLTEKDQSDAVLFDTTLSDGKNPSKYFENIKISFIRLELSFQNFKVRKYISIPKFETIELYSYIGGYMGMWLGLSLISLFDFAETMLQLFYYLISHRRKKIKRRNKNTFIIK